MDEGVITKTDIQTDSSFGAFLQGAGGISPEDVQMMVSKCARLTVSANEIILKEGEAADKLFFVESGAVRNFTSDKAGNEHTTHFAFENEFVADYRAFLTHTNSAYSLQALKPACFIVIPRDTYDWLIANVTGGQSLVLGITEQFLIYFATRLRDNYVLTPLERYQAMEEKFPGIYKLVPQYMIASYIGVSEVHLSRLINQARQQNLS